MKASKCKMYLRQSASTARCEKRLKKVPVHIWSLEEVGFQTPPGCIEGKRTIHNDAYIKHTTLH